MITNVRYGKPCSYDYEILLDHFSGLNTNSIRTSTIPLVQFWKDTNQRAKQLLDALKESTNSVTLCFEYPTVSPKGHGKASMTDLMVICGNSKIAIEAKFTEYLPENGHPENIEGWLQKATSDNRQQVLEGWTSLIEPFSQGINPQLQHSLDYQFYHRTASACAGSEKAAVVYLLFYEKENEEAMTAYTNRLKAMVEVINPKRTLSFHVWQVEVTSIREVEDTAFTAMKKEPVYRFGAERLVKL